MNLTHVVVAIILWNHLFESQLAIKIFTSSHPCVIISISVCVLRSTYDPSEVFELSLLKTV